MKISAPAGKSGIEHEYRLKGERVGVLAKRGVPRHVSPILCDIYSPSLS